jgi:hypothetical protein
MRCRLTIGPNYIDLAGDTGVSSETQGLQVSTEASSQTVAYVGADESRNFWRPGTLTAATFNSTLTFSTKENAQAYMGQLGDFIKNQEGAVAEFGSISSAGSIQIETATASGTVGTEVVVTNVTSGATIYYTTDGTTPTTGSSIVASGDSVIVPHTSGTGTLKLLATETSSTDSPIKITNFIASPAVVPEPIVAPDTSDQPSDNVVVTVTSVISGTTMHYTTNGSTPTTGSPIVASGGAVVVPNPGTLKVMAVKAGMTNSPIKEASYVQQFVSGPPIATGGDEIGTYTDGGVTYKYHKFTSNGSFDVTREGDVDVLIVGAGGAGGGRVTVNGGGGGAGQVLEDSSVNIPIGSYSVVIGDGGVSSTTSPSPATTDGGSSDFADGAYIAAGGGGGGTGSGQNGRSGASGGGATPNGTGGAATAGSAGGNGISTGKAGGGGGAGAAGGSQSSSTTDLAGAAGVSKNYDGASTEYGIGGRVDDSITGTLTPGSGGAGKRASSGTSLGQNGANGIVIIRYPVPVDNNYVSCPTLNPEGGNVASSNINVTITRFGINDTFTIPVLAGESASTWAGEVRTALSNNKSIGFGFDVSGTGTSIVLTSKRNQTDGTLNIAIANGSPSPGITPAPTSINTQAGGNDTFDSALTIYDAIAQVAVAYKGASLGISSSITGRTTDPNA